jgi:hypothetical protein
MAAMIGAVFGSAGGVGFRAAPLVGVMLGGIGGVFNGVMLVGPIAAAEIFLPPTRLGHALERTPFLVTLALKVFVYGIVIVCVRYFLTVRHPSLLSGRTVCDRPRLVGRSGSIACGFVVFLENGELTLECQTWGPESVPVDFRDRRPQPDTRCPGQILGGVGPAARTQNGLGSRNMATWRDR